MCHTTMLHSIRRGAMSDTQPTPVVNQYAEKNMTGLLKKKRFNGG